MSKKIITILTIIVFSFTILFSITSYAKTSTYRSANHIVSLNKNTINNNKATFNVKGNKTVTLKVSDILADGSSLYNYHAVSNNIINIMRKNARFDYTITNKKGKVIGGGSIKNGGTIKIKNNLLSTCTISIISRYVNDGNNIYVSNGKQYAKGNGKSAAEVGGYWIEY